MERGWTKINWVDCDLRFDWLNDQNKKINWIFEIIGLGLDLENKIWFGWESFDWSNVVLKLGHVKKMLTCHMTLTSAQTFNFKSSFSEC